jgi:predicted amidohydrolase YtcJ
VDETFSLAEAVAIHNGRFVAVGSTSQIRGMAGPGTDVVDLEGRTVLPGFNDPHLHYAHSLGFEADEFTLRFRNSKSIQEMLTVVQDKIAETPKGEMIWFFLGPGNPSMLEEGRFPNRFDLDPISPDHPVLLEFGGSGANSSANTLALKKAGIDRRTRQPSRDRLIGRVVTDSSGNPTGEFDGRGATSIARSLLVRHATETLVETTKRAEKLVLPYGITTIGDPNTNMASPADNLNWVKAYQRLDNRGELIVRVNNIMRMPILYWPVDDILEWFQGLHFDPGFGSESLRFSQIKISVYDPRSGYDVPREDVKRVIREVHRAGWQLYIHTGRGYSYDLAIEGLEEAYQEFPREDARHIITHARFPTEEIMEVLSRHGIIVEPQTGALYAMGDDYEEQTEDPDRPAFGVTPLRSYLDNGVVVITGSDQNPVGPLFTVFESVNRLRQSGKVIYPDERITLEEAIRAITITPAFSTFEENLKGSIEPGKLADLVVLGQDILAVAPEEIKDIPVMQTMIGGRFVYTNPNPDPNQEVEYWYPTRGRRGVLNIAAN